MNALSSRTKKTAAIAALVIICGMMKTVSLRASGDTPENPLFFYEKLAARLNLRPAKEKILQKTVKEYRAARIRLTAELKVAEVEFSELIENEPFNISRIKILVNQISDLKKKVAENYVTHLIKTKSLFTDEQLDRFKLLKKQAK
ncbi:MAG: Spy/CpxP family protein refolding chaperone [bacterium]